MRSVGVGGFDEIRATGGGSRSPLWRRILADVLETTVVTTTTSEGAAQGAAMLAAVGVGWFPTVADACREVVTLGERVDPSRTDDVYRERYVQFRSLYPALAPTFHSG
jgi:xylulokinase